MSKFFIQLFLSVLIGLGAAAGFSPHVREELNQTWHKTNTSLHEVANVTVKTGSDVMTQAKTSVSVSAQADAKASTKGNLKADTKANSSLDAQVVTKGALIDDSLTKSSLDASLKVDSQTNAKINTEGVDLSVKDKTNTTLDIGLDLGK